MLNNIGTVELLVIGSVLFFLFGSKKVPELARGIGESIRELRKVTKEE